MLAVVLLLVAGASHAARPAHAARLVYIDPGHPSETSTGGTVQNGTTEVHIAWRVAGKLRARLEAAGIRAALTKSAEHQFVSNRDRALAATRAGADVLVRLHCDTGDGSGFALYAPDRPGTVGGVTGPTPEVIARSLEAARAIHRGMAAVLRGVLADGGVRGDSATRVGARQGALTGSIFSAVPVVTIEMVVLSNVRDAAFIRSSAGQDWMAAAIAAGIERYLDGLPAR